MTRNLRQGLFICVLSGLLAGAAAGQVITAISPSTTAAGSAGFVLAVSGSGFDSGAVVEFDGQELETVPVSSSLLKALVVASDVATGGKDSVIVVNSDGSVSNSVRFTVTGKSGSSSPPPTSGVVTVTISAPSQHLTLCSPVTLSASATTTSKDANIIRWVVTDQNGNQLYSVNGVHSIAPALGLAAGVHTLTVEAYDSAGVTGTAGINFTITASTAVCGPKSTPPSGGSVVSVRGCGYSQVGLTYEAVSFTVTKAITLPFDAKLYYGPGCVSTELADEFGFGQKISFDADSYIFWFGDFPDNPDTSAIWTIGSLSSGCINYSSAPPC